MAVGDKFYSGIERIQVIDVRSEGGNFKRQDQQLVQMLKISFR
jgi:hypothetical protein